MKSYIKKILIVLGIVLMILPSIAFAHSGRTDSNGGHKDNQNKSGLGSYHYHCGGYSAHLHPNGICPYSSDSSTNTTNNTQNNNTTKPSVNNNTNNNVQTTPSTSSETQKEQETQNVVEAKSVAINEYISDLNVGDNMQLTP